MDDIKILHYKIKYQDSNIAIIKFSREEINNFLKNSLIWIETGGHPYFFWECFEDALFEIRGVAFVAVYDYEIAVFKEVLNTNWGKIIEDIIWSSLFFLNPDGGAIQISTKDGKKIGKLISHRFETVEPEPRKK